MKVAIVAPSPSPYTPGGAESVWRGLERTLGEHHEVEVIKLPFPERTLPEVIRGYRSFASLDLDHFDLVISGKYPAWMVEHRRHVVYLLHPLRGLYDSYPLFGLPSEADESDPQVARLLRAFSSLHSPTSLQRAFEVWDETVTLLGGDHPALAHPGPVGRQVVRRLDAYGLRPQAIARYAAISRTVSERPDYLPVGVTAEVAYPPSDLTGYRDEPGEFFFTASRHDAPKRLDLLVEGMRHYRGSLRLLVAGSGPETERLRALAQDDPRVQLVGRLSPDALVDHYARSVGVPFVPHEEDLGLITIEALASGKPVLTCRDSGGPLELVRDGKNGIVVEPAAAAVGRGLQQLEELAADPLTSGRARASVAGISWAAVAETLTAPLAPRRTGRGARPRVVVVSTFPIWPPTGGGQLRCFHLYGGLTDAFDVDVLSLGAREAAAVTRELAPGFTETVVPKSAAHQQAEDEVTRHAGIPVTDIVAAELTSLTPAYAHELGQLLRGAQAVILAHPFLHPTVAGLRHGKPVVYDAHNCEAVLKDAMLPRNDESRRLRALVDEVEGAATRSCALAVAVSEEDRLLLADRYGVPAAKIALVPNGVDTRDIPFTPPSQRAHRRTAWLAALRAHRSEIETKHLALFLGSWHQPNIEAALEILRMAPEAPEVAFVLIGSHCEAIRDHRIPPNVLLMGVVSDATKKLMLGTCDVALAPLRTGSGTNLKVVEYLAAGLPVVTTSVGARGLPRTEGIWHEAECDAFVEAIRRVLADPPGADGLERGRALAEAGFDWHALSAQLRLHLGPLLPQDVSAGG